MSRASQSSRGKLKWILLLVLPPALLLGTAAALAVWGRELYHSEAVARAQSDGKREILFGPAYSSPEVFYKQTRIETDAPEILVLGSSRVLPFRREFFKNDVTFYNGGRIARDIWIVRQSLAKLPDESLPKLLIVGLDQYNFNASESDYKPSLVTEALVHKHFRPREEGWARFGQIWPAILGDAISGKIRLTRERHTFEAVGLNARINGSGFRNDGSYRYGDILSTPPHARDDSSRMEPTLKRIARGSSRFRPGDAVNMAVVEEVGRLVDHCTIRGIQLVAFLPPYAPSAMAAMRAATPSYSYLEQLSYLLAPQFASSGRAFFDFSLAPESSDAEFTDGFHGGELLYARMLLEMATGSEALESSIDRQRLEKLQREAQDPLDPLR